ncbi:bifunctional 3,4-dihydroxy-2-butanone-4-phosphate synthase/GTP cyclohydrolase II [bacterium]|nr:bifunctional 3,4-dihydroxy-2-butanone-4-phosphate synthase/GTP cyclohydrolase II [bacterium]
MPISKIEDAIKDIKKGKMVILVDDQDRENEGDLIVAAEFTTPEVINFMATHGRGLICLSVDTKKASELDLSPVNKPSEENLDSTAFTVSIDAKKDVTTGISAHDRSRTATLVANDSASAADFDRPGHMFPLVARDGGILVRAGHTEASVDISRLAGLKPCAVICEIMNNDGSMARLKDCEKFGKKHKIKIATIADLISYRLKKESFVSQSASCSLPTDYGDFMCYSYDSEIDNKTHLAFVKGKIKDNKEYLVRVHSECLTGDLLGSRRCDCGSQLHKALDIIKEEGEGVLLYLRQEGRGIGIKHKIKAYALQEEGLDTVEANHALGFKEDLREYGTGAQILRDLGLKKIKLLTNNPRKVAGLDGFGLEITKTLAIETIPKKENMKYLKVKKKKLGHKLSLVE